MKKIKEILIVLTLIGLLTSCTNVPEITFFSLPEFTKDDSVITFSENFPYEVGYQESIDKNAEETKIFTFLGVTYNLKYDYSVRKEFTPYTENVYADNGNAKFGFNAETGELTSVFSMNGISQTIIDAPFTEDDYKKIVESLLSGYISTSEYDVSIITEMPVRKEIDGSTVGSIEKFDEFRKSESDSTKYYFTYNRKYGEMNTSEYALVTLNGNGNIVMLQLNSIGYFKADDKTILRYSETGKLISEKLLEYYESFGNLLIEIKSILICKTHDGTPYYIISATSKPKNESVQDVRSIIIAALEGG